VLRYYIRVAETMMWADRPEVLMRDLPRPDDLPPGIGPPRGILSISARTSCFV
jgi:hypothetical protein